MKHQPLAYIHPDAKIADNVTIEPFAVIYENVEIGEGTWIGPNAVVMPGARIGKHCQIHPSAVISNIPQDLKFKGEETLAIVGDHTVIRECVTVNRGTVDQHKTEIGKNCLLMAYVHIAHDCIIADNCIFANAVQVAGHVEVGYHAFVGGASAVHQFVKIGAHAMIGGGSLVRMDVPPYVLAAREPLVYEGVNLVGLRRRKFTTKQIQHIQEIYKIVFQSGFNNSQSIPEIEANVENSPEKDEILNFLKDSLNGDRGMIKGR